MPIGAGELRTIQERMLWMLRPVESSVSACCRSFAREQHDAMTRGFHELAGIWSVGGVAAVKSASYSGLDVSARAGSFERGQCLGFWPGERWPVPSSKEQVTLLGHS